MSEEDRSKEELYEHRFMLFGLLCRHYNGWKSELHHDGTSYEGWFIAGCNLPEGMVTYHIPNRLWDNFPGKYLERAPKWDGHTSLDVLDRLKKAWTFESENYIDDSGKFFHCDCGEEGVFVGQFDWDIIISIFMVGGRRNRKWHHIKKILKDGTPYTDQLIMCPSRARQLGEFLIKLADKKDEEIVDKVEANKKLIKEKERDHCLEVFLPDNG